MVAKIRALYAFDDTDDRRSRAPAQSSICVRESVGCRWFCRGSFGYVLSVLWVPSFLSVLSDALNM